MTLGFFIDMFLVGVVFPALAAVIVNGIDDSLDYESEGW